MTSVAGRPNPAQTEESNNAKNGHQPTDDRGLDQGESAAAACGFVHSLRHQQR